MLRPTDAAGNATMPFDKEVRRERSTKSFRPPTYNRATSSSSVTYAQLDARDLLWNRLQGRQLGGFRFHRELKIPPHEVDFVCLGRRLVVEVLVDETPNEAVDEALREVGYRVVRFREQDVLMQTEAVLQAILKVLAEQRRR